MPVAAHAEVFGYNTEDVTDIETEKEIKCDLVVTAGVWSLDGNTSLKKTKREEYCDPSSSVSKGTSVKYVTELCLIKCYLP